MNILHLIVLLHKKKCRIELGIRSTPVYVVLEPKMSYTLDCLNYLNDLNNIDLGNQDSNTKMQLQSQLMFTAVLIFPMKICNTQ